MANLALGQPDPEWTDSEYEEAGTRDDLGVETHSETILAGILPGVNNQTSRARYYSFWAWVLRDYILDPRADHSQQHGLYDYLRPREDLLVLSHLAHGHESGTAGVEQGSRIWQSGMLDSYPLDWRSMAAAEGGAYQAYFRGVLQEMSITRRSEGIAPDDLTRTVGIALADAYHSSVADTNYVRHYLGATRLRKEDIENFAAHGCLCAVRGHEAERSALIDAFFRFENRDVQARRRLSSLAFLMDVVGQSAGEALDDNSFRAVLYFWSYGQHHAYLPSERMLDLAQRWRVFQLRQYFVYAIEVMWALFLSWLWRQGPHSGTEYLNLLLADLDLGAVAGDCGVKLPAGHPADLALADFLEAVRASLPVEALGPGQAALCTVLNEHTLHLRMRNTWSSGSPRPAAGLALLSLALMYWRCPPWREDRAWVYVSDSWAQGRLPMDSFLAHTSRAAADRVTLAQWIGWLHRDCLWLQHRRVVLDKMLQRGRELARFDIEDGPADSHGERRFRGLGVDGPTFNAPRFLNALSILTDLGLIEHLDNGGYALTVDGGNLLERCQFHLAAGPEDVTPTP